MGCPDGSSVGGVCTTEEGQAVDAVQEDGGLGQGIVTGNTGVYAEQRGVEGRAFAELGGTGGSEALLRIHEGVEFLEVQSLKKYTGAGVIPNWVSKRYERSCSAVSLKICLGEFVV